MQRAVKSALTRVGARVSPRMIHRLEAALNYLEVGHWMRAHGFEVGRRMDTREQVFDSIATVVADERVLYVEFGVFEGDSMRTWSRLLRNQSSHLHGFDSFEGLPEDWSLEEQRGHFSTRGVVPRIDDPRARLFKGWFQDTLSRYEPPAHDRLVVNIDSDLYTSAAQVLLMLEDVIVPGTFLYFDEFNHRAHELRAFDEFLERTGTVFRLVGASRELSHVAFVRES